LAPSAENERRKKFPLAGATRSSAIPKFIVFAQYYDVAVQRQFPANAQSMLLGTVLEPLLERQINRRSRLAEAELPLSWQLSANFPSMRNPCAFEK